MKNSTLFRISNKIKEQRIALGYTQQEFSEKINILYRHYVKMENALATPSLDTIIKICEELNLSLDNLIFNYGDEDYQKDIEKFHLYLKLKKFYEYENFTLLDIKEFIDLVLKIKE